MTTVTHQHASPGRLPELALSVLAIGISLLIYILSRGEIPADIAKTAAVFGGTALIGHLLIRVAAPYADPVLYPTVLVINGISLAVLHRLNPDDAASQSLYTIMGVVVAIVVLFAVHDHRTLRRFTYTSLVIGIILLLMPLFPVIGWETKGARIWIRLGPLSAQPAELAKVALAIFFAGYLVVNRDNLALAGRKVLGMQLPRLRHFAPLVVAWLACLAVLIGQKDLGTALLFFGLFVSMLYVATDRLSWMIIGAILAGVGGAATVKLFPHVMARFHVWLHAMEPAVYEAKHGSYQVVQAHFGMAAGGLLGTGLGEGTPDVVPEANSDFIISTIGEELGMATVFAILCLYLVLVIRGLRTASYVRDGFGKLLAAGLSFTIALQVFVVVGGVTRLIPLTGLTLPFLARGGSSLLCNWLVLGLLLRISNAARRPQGRAAEPLPPAWEDYDEGGEPDDDDEPDPRPGHDVPRWSSSASRRLTGGRGDADSGEAGPRGAGPGEDAPASSGAPSAADAPTELPPRPGTGDPASRPEADRRGANDRRPHHGATSREGQAADEWPGRDDDDRPTEAVKIR